MGKEVSPTNDSASAQALASLSFRKARAAYGCSYSQWRAAREQCAAGGFIPRRAGARERTDVVAEVLDSVASHPHWNTAERALQLKRSPSTVQAILKRNGLSKRNARLRHAGFEVATIRPLDVARQRRIVASYPGSLVHIDFKLFGLLRGSEGKASIRVSGVVVVDSFSSWAGVHLTAQQTTQAALAGLRAFTEGFERFRPHGYVMSDNGAAFTADAFLAGAARLGYVLRTTRHSHPWSNGKVEALNKTLKYQCFPALTAQMPDTLEQLQPLVDAWMHDYNTRRAHGGHMNRGLPPAELLRRFNEADGHPMARLRQLGLLPATGSIRPLGGSSGGRGDLPTDEQGYPLVLVHERQSRPAFVDADFLPSKRALHGSKGGFIHAR